MIDIKLILRGTCGGILLSSMIHMVLAGSLYYRFVIHRPEPIVAELDLSMMPLIPITPMIGGGYGTKQKGLWTLPKQGKAPMPQMVSKEEIAKQENEATLCPEPCPEMSNKTVNGPFVPASEASRKPRWIKNFITPQDYPSIARKEGKDGRVVLLVFIDTEGRVDDARLIQGSYEEFNEVALRKVKEALFTPAYNKENQPISCKVTLPIRFELKDKIQTLKGW